MVRKGLFAVPVRWVDGLRWGVRLQDSDLKDMPGQDSFTDPFAAILAGDSWIAKNKGSSFEEAADLEWKHGV
jgi:hypothetical protein